MPERTIRSHFFLSNESIEKKKYVFLKSSGPSIRGLETRLGEVGQGFLKGGCQYAYCLNNPVLFVDKEGKEPVIPTPVGAPLPVPVPNNPNAMTGSDLKANLETIWEGIEIIAAATFENAFYNAPIGYLPIAKVIDAFSNSSSSENKKVNKSEIKAEKKADKNQKTKVEQETYEKTSEASPQKSEVSKKKKTSAESDYGTNGAEHVSGKSPSKKNDHQKGRARNKRDRGGEKGDVRRMRYK